jgi:hypothetical protein
MSIQSQSRALMIRHHQRIRCREQSMLLRLHEELGLDVTTPAYHSQIQGKIPPDFSSTYDRGQVAIS